MMSLILMLAACDFDGADGLGPAADDTALRSRVAVDLDTDVQGVALTATQVDCVTGTALPDGEVHNSGGDLLGMRLGDFELGLDPLAPESDHDFADVFVTVSAGCYTVVAEPLDDNGDPSADCSTAVSDGIVTVVDGQTTEVLLLSTCDGQATGGLDSIIAFNEEPTVSDFTYDPSKFTDVCAAPVTVCAEVTDPNMDPVELTWDVGTASHTVLSHTQVDDLITECVEITPADDVDFDIQIAAYDLLDDGTRIEDYLASIGNPVDSHDTFAAPLHVSGTDADGDGFYDCQDCDDSDALVNPAEAEICGNGLDDNCDGQIDEGCALQTVDIEVSVDNAYQIWVDGQPVTSGPNANAWDLTDVYSLDLGPGQHVIAIYAEDHSGAAFISARAQIGGSTITHTADGTWVATAPEVFLSPAPLGSAQPGDGAAGMSVVPDAGWNTVGFNSAGWSQLSTCSDLPMSNFSPWYPDLVDLMTEAGIMWATPNCQNLPDATATFVRGTFTL